MDEYTKEWLKAIQQAKTDEEIAALINKIYEEGFQDGNDAKQDRD